jgi:hypothetical protein
MSSTATTPQSATTTAGSTTTAVKPLERYPLPATLEFAMKIAIEEDRPIMLDYWSDSLEKKVAIIVHTETKEKFLVKSDEEYTSPIMDIKRCKTDFIVKTENSIYLVSADVPIKQLKN